MARTAKKSPIDVFEENISDAHQLIALAAALSDYRKYRPRSERRHKLGSALGLPKRDWDHLDSVESAQAFVILKPNGGLTRAQFTEEALRPLL